MSLSILNNIPSLAACAQLSISAASLNKTLQRMSSGSRLNSSADDAAGLAIADGLKSNIMALTQSSRNASDGVGLLQVADGTMSQVTALLDRAITLATESANSTVSASQRVALNAEFTAIKQEIDRASNATYNGRKVFGGGAGANQWASSTAAVPGGLTPSDILLTNGDTLTVTDDDTGHSAAFTVSNATTTLQDLLDYMNGLMPTVNPGLVNADITAAVDANGFLTIADNNGNGSVSVTSDLHFNGTAATIDQSEGNDFVYLGDGATGARVSMSIGALNAGRIGFTGGIQADLSDKDLLTVADARVALWEISDAIANIAADRGNVGAVVNQLESATKVMNAQVQNLSSAEDGIRAADMGVEVANLARSNILQQTGMAALAQSNQMQQIVLKLLQ